MEKYKVAIIGAAAQSAKGAMKFFRKDGEIDWEEHGFDIVPYEKAIEGVKEKYHIAEENYKIMDVTDAEKVRKELIGKGFTHAIYFSAQTKMFQQMRDVNAGGLENVLSAFEEDSDLTGKKARVVAISTGSIYKGDKEPVPLEGATEDHEVGPMKSPFIQYSMSKIEVEAIAKDYNKRGKVDVIVTRPGMIVSEHGGDFGAMTIQPIAMGMGSMLSSIVADFPVGWTTAKNVGAAQLHILKHGKAGETYNIADDMPMSFPDFVEGVAKGIEKTCLEHGLKSASVLGKAFKIFADKYVEEEHKALFEEASEYIQTLSDGMFHPGIQIPWKSILSDEIKRREMAATGVLINSKLVNFGIGLAYGSLLHPFKMPPMLDLDSIIGKLGQSNWTFDNSNLKSTGYETVENLEDALPKIMEKMLKNGTKLGWPDPNPIATFGMLGDFYQWFLNTKYEMDPDKNPYGVLLAWQNRRVGWNKWNPKPPKEEFARRWEKIDAYLETKGTEIVKRMADMGCAGAFLGKPTKRKLKRAYKYFLAGGR